jgi:hypothetical protein
MCQFWQAIEACRTRLFCNARAGQARCVKCREILEVECLEQMETLLLPGKQLRIGRPHLGRLLLHEYRQ